MKHSQSVVGYFKFGVLQIKLKLPAWLGTITGTKRKVVLFVIGVETEYFLWSEGNEILIAKYKNI